MQLIFKLYKSIQNNVLKSDFWEGYTSSINDVKGILALRIGSDCDAKRFVKAKNIIHSIAMQMNDGYIFNNIIAAFTGALSKAEHYNVQPNGYKKPVTTRKVPFYDWLKERE